MSSNESRVTNRVSLEMQLLSWLRRGGNIDDITEPERTMLLADARLLKKFKQMNQGKVYLNSLLDAVQAQSEEVLPNNPPPNPVASSSRAWLIPLFCALILASLWWVFSVQFSSEPSVSSQEITAKSLIVPNYRINQNLDLSYLRVVDPVSKVSGSSPFESVPPINDLTQQMRASEREWETSSVPNNQTSRELSLKRETSSLPDHSPAPRKSPSKLFRVFLKTSSQQFSHEQFMDWLKPYSPIKGGQVELGWFKKPNVRYYHFIVKNHFESVAKKELARFGTFTWSEENHPRDLDIDKIRFIIEVEQEEP